MGILPFDGLFFGLMLVVPKFTLAVLVWWTGTRHLVLSRDLFDMLFRASALHYTASIERQLFNSFLAHSKKQWVKRTSVLQERHIMFRPLISWPGEIAKFLASLLLLAISWYMYKDV